MFVPFSPQPPPGAAPTIFPTPFVPGRPHPLAERAALESHAFISAHPRIDDELFAGRFGGKMFGVLAARHPDGRLGYLRGFAGKLNKAWCMDGFVPPAFDEPAFEALWGPGGREISRLDNTVIAALKAAGHNSPAHKAALAAQQAASRALHEQLYATYRIVNATGEATSLRSLFEPRLPPGGAGDCAAPKLLARAYALGLHPLALAEFWWGPPPPAGGRQHRVYYPACRGRCAKLLPFMLEGLECEPAPDVGLKTVPDSAPTCVFEDEHMIVVDKPAGLLSVPGRGPTRQDCVERRLQTRLALPDPAWPRAAHRLDLATSGLLIAAKHRDAYVHLQRQFSSRTVHKRYIAIVRGELPGKAVGECGTIELPLGRDLNDRPRQKHDPHGKASSTEWEVLAHEAGNTRVALHPKTGRTHQLRLHAAHALGLGTPIVGDLLYGFGGERLLLHAQSISFAHPVTGVRMSVECECPF